MYVSHTKYRRSFSSMSQSSDELIIQVNVSLPGVLGKVTYEAVKGKRDTFGLMYFY